MSLKRVDIRGHKSQNSGGTRCRGFVVLESQCCVFLVLESWYCSFLSSEKTPWNHNVVVYLSPFFDVVVFQSLNLDVVVFWSWNLDVVVFWSWNLDVVVFWSWNPNVVVYRLGIWVGICAPMTMFSLSLWKQKNHANISIVQIYATSICITYAQVN